MVATTHPAVDLEFLLEDWFLGRHRLRADRRRREGPRCRPEHAGAQYSLAGDEGLHGGTRRWFGAKVGQVVIRRAVHSAPDLFGRRRSHPSQSHAMFYHALTPPVPVPSPSARLGLRLHSHRSYFCRKYVVEGRKRHVVSRSHTHRLRVVLQSHLGRLAHQSTHDNQYFMHAPHSPR